MFERLRRLLGFSSSEAVNLPSHEPPEPLLGENLLILSDLHLGEACKEHSRIEYLKRGARLDEEFCLFLERHKLQRPGNRPWRLVLTGDTFDFLQVTLSPAGSTNSERRYGLGTREPESVWKLERLAERHRRAFLYLADFVGAGNRLEVVSGNHDVELFWPAVRQTLVQILTQLYFGGESLEQTPEEFAARIHFSSWFYYQPGLIYLEHGHRLDPFCATPPQLCPLRPHGEAELTQPVSGLAIRYFANLERGFKTHDKEHWGLREYYRYYRAQGFGGIAGILKRYLGLSLRSFRYYLEHGRFQSERALEEHQHHLRELAEHGKLSLEQLGALEAQSAHSVTSDLFGLYTTLGLAEWTGGFLSLSTLILILNSSWGWFFESLLLFGALGSALFWVRWSHARYPNATRGAQRHAAEAISQLLEVPVVVMGHTHSPLRLRMKHDHRALYLNTGCFLPPEQPSHAGDQPCDCPSTFILLEHSPYGQPKPRLQRWCCVRKRVEPYRR